MILENRKTFALTLLLLVSLVTVCAAVSLVPLVRAADVAVTVWLKDSSNNGLDGGVVQYYSGSWQSFGTTGETGTGYVTKNLPSGNYAFRMDYGNARNEKWQNVGTNPTVVFQTVDVEVQLKDSTGAFIDTGTVSYYYWGWQSFGTTSSGKVSKELLPNNYAFRMDYGNARNEKWQDVGVSSTVVFQTVKVTVELRDSGNNLIDTGTVAYYYWSWKTFGSGSTSGGQASMELLPNNYALRMDYANARNEKWQNVGTKPTVIFQTVLVTVELRDHAGNLLNGGGTVSYYYWSWLSFGTTSDGQVSKELLPNNYCFRMDYANARNEKWQNVGTKPTVTFQTGKITLQFSGDIQYYYWSWNTFTKPSMELLPNVYYFRFDSYQTSVTVNAGDDIQLSFVVIKLLSSAGSGIAGGTAQYYNGRWNDIPGSTGSNGVLLHGIPGIVPTTFISMTHAYARQQKGPLNIASNSYVVFQTAKVTVELKDSTGAYITGGLGTVQYYSGGWRTFGSGTTDGGKVSMELLPVSYWFSMDYVYAREQKGWLAVSGASYTVTFQTGKVHSGTNTCTQYYAGAWRAFTQGMELLPGKYYFRFSDGTADTQYAIVAGTTNTIH